jgi:hypothetical protein
MQPSIFGINRAALKILFSSLSIEGCLHVTGTLTHLVDRADERVIDFEAMMKVFANVINGCNFCTDLYETACNGGCKNFSKWVGGIKIYYSVYIADGTYKVVFRSVAK